jgi:hypothetical protein
MKNGDSKLTLKEITLALKFLRLSMHPKKLLGQQEETDEELANLEDLMTKP